ncbi:MAG: hypothetical protein Q9168_004277 [Polycauliona sp. 1 TL-2023]
MATQTRRRRHAAREPSLQHPYQPRSSTASSSRFGSHPPDQDRSPFAHVAVGLAAEQDAEINEREEDDSLNEVVMALEARDRGTVGCAYYIAREEKLYMMQDMSSGGIDIVDLLKLHAQPTVILLSTKSDEQVSIHLDPTRGNIESTAGDADDLSFPYLLEVRPSPEFGFESAKTKLSNIRLPNSAASQMAFVTPGDAESYEDYIESSEPDYTGRQGKLLRLSGIVDLESRLTVGCAGAVLTYLQRRKAVVYLPGDDTAQPAFRVSAIGMFSLDGVMFIDAETLGALQFAFHALQIRDTLSETMGAEVLPIRAKVRRGASPMAFEHT